jgi:hypothetical protein
MLVRAHSISASSTSAQPISARSAALAVLVLALAGCGDDDASTPAPTPTADNTTAEQATERAEADRARAEASAELADSLPNALLLSYAQFAVENGAVTTQPGPARLEILRRAGGEWHTEVLEDYESRVFHKAMVYTPHGGEPGLLTLGGSAPCPESGARDCKAQLKLWRRDGASWRAELLWEQDFGGRFNRMRDAEVDDLYGDGKSVIAVATHDQGVVAVVRPGPDGITVDELDREENIFVHEIELGDLDGDGVVEVYATPSEPNNLQGHAQSGHVVRYVPKNGHESVVVADLGDRHAKEILVADVDGDGRDELYVAVEALMEGNNIAQPVEIRRYDHDTPADQGVVIATIPDRFTRFLTVGDVDGDGKKEMVAAAFRSGLWLLRPGRDARAEWSSESIDRDSSGFEHAAIIADLDDNGTDELYVAADEQGELRRYVWVDGRARRETLHTRELPRALMTWNIMSAPVSVVGPPSAD